MNGQRAFPQWNHSTVVITTASPFVSESWLLMIWKREIITEGIGLGSRWFRALIYSLKIIDTYSSDLSTQFDTFWSLIRVVLKSHSGFRLVDEIRNQESSPGNKQTVKAFSPRPANGSIRLANFEETSCLLFTLFQFVSRPDLNFECSLYVMTHFFSCSAKGSLQAIIASFTPKMM